MLDNEQTQPHQQQAECDPGDRYAEQNTHDRGPQRWPSTDLEIYALESLYAFRRTSGNVSTARELVGVAKIQCRQLVELSKISGSFRSPHILSATNHPRTPASVRRSAHDAPDAMPAQ